MRQLRQEQFELTFSGAMNDVTNTAEAVTDIWPYVRKLVNDKVVLKYVYDNCLVEKVYRNSTSTFEHVLLPTSTENIFVAIVIDLMKNGICGHHVLDLNKLYAA